ncbi:MAG TPA: hypothetical protein VF991_15100 [Reyranella sp.]
MKLLRRTLIALAGLPLTGGAGHAGPFDGVWARPVWTEWELSAATRRGPDTAGGLLLYFHGRGPGQVTGRPIPGIFIEMAKIASWDILRINRASSVDDETGDDQILEVVAHQITEARQAGYERIIAGGGSGGGWLALLAATLPGVDAAIGLAPGTGSYETRELARTRDLLAQKLAGARAKRVAAFFFEGDWGVSEGRAAVIRQGLQNSGSTFMVVDRPADLPGHAAMGSGRLVRRYRDCLLQFIQNADQPAGEVQCSRPSGYAVGSEIGFPADLPVLQPPADPAFAPYLGRWEGDDELGAYLIMQSIAVGPTQVIFRTGYSAAFNQPPRTWVGDVAFELDEANRRIVCKLPDGLDDYRVALKSATELEFQALLRNVRGASTLSFSLRKQDSPPAAR